MTWQTTRVAAAGAVVVRAAVKETDPHKRVVITGMGVASVFGNDVEQFYNRRAAGCVWGPGKALAKRCNAALLDMSIAFFLGGMHACAAKTTVWFLLQS